MTANAREFFNLWQRDREIQAREDEEMEEMEIETDLETETNL